MDNPGIYNLGDRQITTALSGEVITSGAAGGSGAAQAFVDRLAGMRSVTLYVKFAYGSGGETCVVVVETSINQGGDWVEVARFDFATADTEKAANVSAEAAVAVAAIVPLSADGKLDGILGDRLRAKATSSGSYAGTVVSVRAAVR